MNKWYRIRCRDNRGKSYVAKDGIKTLEEAYELIAFHGTHCPQNRKYSIDEVKPELFSVVTAKVAKKRLEELHKEEEDNE